MKTFAKEQEQSTFISHFSGRQKCLKVIGQLHNYNFSANLII